MKSQDEDLDAITGRLNESQRVRLDEDESDGKAQQFTTHVPDPLVGKKLDGGRYHILSVIGRGGMSVVYKARQELVDRPVAIKTLTVQLLGDPVVLKRFQREIRALSKLSHPNIVSAFDCVVDSSGQPYFIMDFLDGESLAEIFYDEGKLTQERVQRIFLQVCAAVVHAHSLQVLHRDLKPANIMILHAGTVDELVKVVDFGLAKVSEDAQKLTVTGEVWGSPSYMSPEQVHGKSNDLRSDIYSVGCVMFEALTGRPPFQGATPIDTVMMQVNTTPPTFAEVDPNLKVHPALQAIVLTCLQKNPDERFQSMSELYGALQELDFTNPNIISKDISIAPGWLSVNSLTSVAQAPGSQAPASSSPGWAGPAGSAVPSGWAAPDEKTAPVVTNSTAVPAAVKPTNASAPSTVSSGNPQDAAQGARPSIIGRRPTATDADTGQAPKSEQASPPSVVRTSSAMRSGGNRNSQRLLVAVLIMVGLFGVVMLFAAAYFIGNYFSSKNHGGLPFQMHTATTTSSTEANPASQTRTTEPAQTGTSAPTETGTTVSTQTGTTAPTQTGTTDATQTATTAPTQTGTSVSTQTGTTAATQTGTTDATQTATTAPTQTGTTVSTQTQTTAPTQTGTAVPTQVTTTAPSQTGTTVSTQTKTTAPGHKTPVVAHLKKPNEPRKHPKQHQSSGGGDTGPTYTPPPINDAQRWYDIQKSWSH